MEHIFITADGYRLRREVKWTDGDLSFDEIDGRPVDDQGNPLEGMFSLPVDPPEPPPASTLTIEQFRATRQWWDDLRLCILDDPLEEREQPPQGFVYLDQLYIEQVCEHWPEATRERGRWYLLIANNEYVSDDLARLEEILFEWARDEGYEAAA